MLFEQCDFPADTLPVPALSLDTASQSFLIIGRTLRMWWAQFTNLVMISLSVLEIETARLGDPWPRPINWSPSMNKRATQTALAFNDLRLPIDMFNQPYIDFKHVSMTQVNQFIPFTSSCANTQYGIGSEKERSMRPSLWGKKSPLGARRPPADPCLPSHFTLGTKWKYFSLETWSNSDLWLESGVCHWNLAVKTRWLLCEKAPKAWDSYIGLR